MDEKTLQIFTAIKDIEGMSLQVFIKYNTLESWTVQRKVISTRQKKETPHYIATILASFDL